MGVVVDKKPDYVKDQTTISSAQQFRYPGVVMRNVYGQYFMIIFAFIGFIFMCLSPIWLSRIGLPPYSEFVSYKEDLMGFVVFFLTGFILFFAGILPFIRNIIYADKWQEISGTIIGYGDSNAYVNNRPILDAYIEVQTDDGYKTLCVNTGKTRQPRNVGETITFGIYKNCTKIKF